MGLIGQLENAIVRGKIGSALHSGGPNEAQVYVSAAAQWAGAADGHLHTTNSNKVLNLLNDANEAINNSESATGDWSTDLEDAQKLLGKHPTKLDLVLGGVALLGAAGAGVYFASRHNGN
jgi:hypothetical protein